MPHRLFNSITYELLFNIISNSKLKKMQNETEKKQSIGAWDKTTKNSKAYISFTIDGKLYTMWKNEFKLKPTQPDYKIYEAEPLKPITNE
jgi:hypothetical protein